MSKQQTPEDKEKDDMRELERALNTLKFFSDTRLKETKELTELRIKAKGLEDKFTSQTRDFEELKNAISGRPIDIFTENDVIISKIVDIIKNAQRYIFILAPRIHPESNHEVLNGVFQHIKNKANSGTVENIYIRYREYPDGEGNSGTTRTKISRILGNSGILDIEPIKDLHSRLIMNEKECLILSNNFEPYSFESSNLEIGVLINGDINFIMLEELKQKLRTIFKISI